MYSQSADAVGEVVAVMSVGSQDVAYINNMESGDLYKTVAYERGTLITNEEVLLRTERPNAQEAKVVKELTGIEIPAFKERINNRNCNGLCILYADESKMIVSYTEGSYRINYSSSKVSDEKISSIVRMFKEPSNNNKRENQKVVSSFNLNKEDKDSYRLSTHKDVLKEANRLSVSTNFSINVWEETTTVFENFLLSFKQNENDLFFSELGQNTAFHFASFNILKRSVESNTDCKCTPSPLYFTSTTPFMC